MKLRLLVILLLTVPTTIPAREFTVWLPGGVPLDMVNVPAGTFMMGSPEGERGNFRNNETQHQVTLTKDYYLGKTEVTQQQWLAVMGTPMPLCPQWSDDLWHEIGSYFPVYCVSWNDINGPGGFIERLNDYLETEVFRLPSEAEWERAARADTSTRFSHGDVLECDDVECWPCSAHEPYMRWCGNGHPTCVELDWRDLSQCLRYGIRWPNHVGSRKANPFGLHDMHGNLWEFVNDRYAEFSRNPVTDPEGPGGSGDVVIRGGGAGEARLSRSAARMSAAPDDEGRSDQFGFRIAASNLDWLVFEINSGLNDAWYNPATDGQGFFVTVFPEIKEMFVGWFTYDTERPPDDVHSLLGEPGHRWLTAQGPYRGNKAELTIYLTEGGVFDASEPATTTDQAGHGRMTIEFADCFDGLVNYEIPSLNLSGEIPIQRITLDNVALCEALSAQ